MLKKILLGLLVVIAALLLFAATRPNSYSVSRSMTIKAPPEKLFAMVDSFPAWPLWSPYEKLDPNMKRTIGGAPSGVGATYAWSGNKNAGEGSMQIYKSQPPNVVEIQLEFTKPMAGHDTAMFTFTPKGDSTMVTWTVRGPNPYIAKLLTMFMSMDRMLGGQMMDGLMAMQKVAEK
jgi:uncharacterized protein YndB with AHSA1/START domain